MRLDESSRRQEVRKINTEAVITPEEALRAKYGQLWDTQQMQVDFQVHGFLAPYVKVTRKSDGMAGLLMFSHMPRWYHSFQPEEHDRSSGLRIETV